MDNINIYVVNLGAYNRGYHVGKWLHLPMAEDELQQEIDNILHGEEAKKTQSEYDNDEEVAIHDFECDFMRISEYDSITTLNELAEEIESLDEWEQEKIEAIMQYDCLTLRDAIDNRDDYDIFSDVKNEYDLGYYWIEESGCYEIPENIRYYIDYEKLGRDVSLDEGGVFTDFGYVCYRG